MDKLIEHLRTVDTPTVSNAIEQLAVRNSTTGFCDLNLRCLMPEFGQMCGFAVTAEVEAMSPDEKSGLDENFTDLCRAVQKSEHPAVVVFSERGAHPDFSAHCGEVMATLFQVCGAIGMVTDAAVRDIVEVRALGFHYFARGLVASHGSFRVIRTGVPVTVCGLQIEQGDLLHGDENGLITVPKEKREHLPQAIEKIHKLESPILEMARSKDFDLEELAKSFVH